MDVHAIAERSFVHDPLREHVARVVETIGTPRFEPEFFRMVDATIGCEHLTAFAVSPPDRPRLLLAANRGDAPIARSAASVYLQNHWDSDPTNMILAQPRDLGEGVVACVSAEEMLRLRYRRQCYSVADWATSGSNLIHKVTLIKRRETDTIKVHFYRRRERGPFCGGDVQRIAECADLLLAFLGRHAPIDAHASALTLRRKFQTRLETSFEGITPREAEVCAAIAVGMSSEAIALTLGISLNTVLTYRKRAYARLGICSQNELVRLIYSKLAA